MISFFAQLIDQILLNEYKSQLLFGGIQQILINSIWLLSLKTITKSLYGNVLSVGMVKYCYKTFNFLILI